MKPSGKKVLGLVGSPRHGGNTALLVQRVLDGAASRALPTEIHYLSDLGVAPCDACDACMSTGQCIVEDGMLQLHALFPQTGVLVLGTPIYFDHVSAQLKAFLDRLYLYTGPNPAYRFPAGVKAVLVTTYEDSNPTRYDDVIAWLQERLSYYFKIETVGTVIASHTGSRPVKQRPELLQRAFEIGATLVA